MIDSSAWVEYLRRTGSEANRRVRVALANDEALASTEPVWLEVLVGARDAAHADNLARLLSRAELVPSPASPTIGALRSCTGVVRAARPSARPWTA